MTVATTAQPEAGFCGAKTKSTGDPCRQRPVDGAKRCRVHGGRGPRVDALARRVVAERKAAEALRTGLAAAYGDHVPDIAPTEAMLQAVAWKHAEVMALRVKVREGESDLLGTPETEREQHVWRGMLHGSENQLVRFAAAARAAGCDERRVQLAEQQGLLVAGAVRALLDRLGLTPEQAERAPAIAAEVLRELAAGETQR